MARENIRLISARKATGRASYEGYRMKREYDFSKGKRGLSFRRTRERNG